MSLNEFDDTTWQPHWRTNDPFKALSMPWRHDALRTPKRFLEILKPEKRNILSGTGGTTEQETTKDIEAKWNLKSSRTNEKLFHIIFFTILLEIGRL